jgi:hypothetical protein
MRESFENQKFPFAKEFDRGAMYCFDVADYDGDVGMNVACFQLTKENGAYIARAYIPDHPLKHTIQVCRTYAEARQMATHLRLRCLSV